jgi:hypothetical protein
MPAFNSTDFHPPAPIALVEVRESRSLVLLPNISMLVDTGADVSLLPRASITSLLPTSSELPLYELEAFDGTKSYAPAINCEVRFLGKLFRGQFLVIDGHYEVLGRNILNNLTIAFHGLALFWEEIHPQK